MLPSFCFQNFGLLKTLPIFAVFKINQLNEAWDTTFKTIIIWILQQLSLYYLPLLAVDFHCGSIQSLERNG